MSAGAAMRALAMLAAGLAGCSDSQAPGASGADYTVLYRARSGDLELRTESPLAAELEISVGDVRYDSTAHRLHAWIAIRNAGSADRFGPFGVEVFDFAPAGAWPQNAGCVPPDSTDLPDPCMFDHWGTYGEDRTLSPGEVSTAAEWIVRDPQDTDLWFRARFWWPHGPGS